MGGDASATLLGLLSGLFWGTGDFFGGFASRKVSPYTVIFFGQITGTIVLLAITLITGEPLPPVNDLLMGCVAGAFGGIGLIFFYRAMIVTKMSIVAPVTAVLTGFIPVIFGILTQGAPKPIQLVGMVLALGAIALISREDNAPLRLSDLRLPLISGFAFGMYLTLLHKASDSSAFWPIISGRVASVTLIGIIGWRLGKIALPPLREYGKISASGILDTIGNTLYAAASQLGRLDVAAILSSLYPAATVTLAALILRERLHRVQWYGVILAFIAIVLIAL